IEEASAILAAPYRPEDLDYLELEIKRMRKLRAANLQDDYMASVLAFHRKVVEMSGNSLFLRAWESMAWDVRARICAKRIGLVGPFTDIREQTLQAMREGDARRAGKMLRGVVEQLLKRLAELEKEEQTQALEKSALQQSA